MNKYFTILFFLTCQSLAITIEHGGVNELSKKQILTIIEEAGNLGIKDTSTIKTIRSWWNGQYYDKRYRESLTIVFKPHIEGEFHAINNYLTCTKEIGKSWSCQNKEQFYIRFDVNQEKNIIAFKKESTDIDVLVEVARAANNLRPMSWEQPISAVWAKPQGNYRVTFGTFASSCVQYLTIIREFHGDANLYSVPWDNMKYINSCTSIGGYIDTGKLYVIYANDEWMSD